MMRKIALFMLAAIMIMTLSACGSLNPPQNSSEPTTSPTAPPTTTSSTTPPSSDDATTAAPPEDTENSGTNILVAYFSMPETTDPDNMTRDEDNSVVVVDGEVLGNTQYVAYLIQENTGGDIFRIEPKTPYSTDHNTLTDLAKEEQNSNARPELSEGIDNIDQYDVIFIGYPNWWADMPQILYTFLEAYDLSGKTIVPFNTHGGSGFSNTISAIAELQPNATVERNGFTVSRNTVDSCESDLIAWLHSLNLAQ